MSTMISLEKQKIAGYEIGVRSNPFDFSKRTVILIHGIGVSSAYFVPLTEALAPHYNVFSLDLPGYGKTIKPPHPLNLSELALITAEFIKAHKLNHVILVGHSMGCQIVTNTLKIIPNKIDKLILLGPTVNHNERTILLQGMRLMQDTFYESLKVNAIVFSDYARMGIIRYLKTSKFMVDDHIEDYLKNSAVPTLIIRGTNDHIVPHTWAAFLQSLSKNVVVKEIPKGPHVFQYKYAHEAKELCLKFIEQ
jgi:pimeloyl-ACP methyl ester carboxylesterase